MLAYRAAFPCAAPALLLAFATTTARAQETPPADPPVGEASGDPPATDAHAHAARVNKLEADIKALKDQLDDVREDNIDLEEDIEDLHKAQQTPEVTPIRLNLMNPPITVFGNFAGRADDATVTSPEGAEIDDKAFMRTAEFDFRAAIDPYADGVVILSLEDEAGQGFGADLEEAYLTLKRLPILESAPLGLKLKIGRYRAALGNINRLHMHDLPWTTRPLPIVKYLGTEHGGFFESGYNPEGVDAELLLPQVIPGAVMELNLDVVDTGDIAIANDPNGAGPAVLGHYNLFFTVADNHDFNFGLSTYYDGGEQNASLYVADFLYKWKPFEHGEFKSFVLGGELFYTDRKFAIDTDGDDVPDSIAKTNPLGGFGFAQYQLGWHTYLGARYDYAEEIDDDSVATHIAAAYATYYVSEFLRFRVGYEHRWSDIDAQDDVNSVMFDVNFVIGSHPIEPYWVNR